MRNGFVRCVVWLVVGCGVLVGCFSQQAPSASSTSEHTDSTDKGSTTPTSNTSPTSAPSKPGSPSAQCMKDKGCPPSKTIPKCADSIKPRPLKEALDNRNPLIGQTASIVGPLKSSASCTERGCPADAPCCNRCSGGISLGPEGMGGGSGYTHLTLVDTKNPKGFSCNGDETLVCCTYEAKGQTVVATGKIGTKDGNFSMEDPTLCIP
ncbi:MAG: hypothetical protein AAFX99_08680 [Myxococcota bacterium]